jgi:chemotaxis protein MotA
VSFLKSALEMLVDGWDEREIRDVLLTELTFFRRRRQEHERVFRHTARLAPAFGVAGSVVGLIGMLTGLGDTGVILETIPLALTSTLYGIVLCNFVLTPMAESIFFKTQQELLLYKLIVDGVSAIQQEKNPHKLERKLSSFLTPAARARNQRSFAEIRRKYGGLRPEKVAAS